MKKLRITKQLLEEETVTTNKGDIPAYWWLESEAARICAKGDEAEVVYKKGYAYLARKVA